MRLHLDISSAMEGRGRQLVTIALTSAVVAIMAFLPAYASASHSVLCKENVSVCPEASIWPANTFITSATGFTGTYAEFELPGLTTIGSCSAGKFSGPVSPNKEGPSTGSVSAFFFSSCKPEGCTVEGSTGLAWQWTATGAGNGAILVAKPDLTATCTKSPFAFSCKYAAASLSAKFEHSNPPESAFIKDEGTAMTLVGGTGCLVSNANLRFRTSIRSPGPTYLTN
jgi:hypothetical protein